MDLRAWCRAEGHRFDWQPIAGDGRGRAVIVNGGAEAGRWADAERVGGGGCRRRRRRRRASAAHVGAGGARAPLIEAGTPEFDFHLVDKVEVWSDDAARIYQQAVAAQWDPETAIPWKRRLQPSPTTSRTPSCRS